MAFDHGNTDVVPEGLKYKTVKFTAGPQVMDGETALIYSRSRHSAIYFADLDVDLGEIIIFFIILMCSCTCIIKMIQPSSTIRTSICYIPNNINGNIDIFNIFFYVRFRVTYITTTTFSFKFI